MRHKITIGLGAVGTLGTLILPALALIAVLLRAIELAPAGEDSPGV